MFCFLIYIFGKKHNPVETAATFGVRELASRQWPDSSLTSKISRSGSNSVQLHRNIICILSYLRRGASVEAIVEKPTDMYVSNAWQLCAVLREGVYSHWRPPSPLQVYWCVSMSKSLTSDVEDPSQVISITCWRLIKHSQNKKYSRVLTNPTSQQRMQWNTVNSFNN